MRSATVNRGLKQSADRAQTGRLLALAQCFQAGDGGSIPLTRSTATAAFRQVIPLVDSHYHISERLAHSRVYSVWCGTWVARARAPAPKKVVPPHRVTGRGVARSPQAASDMTSQPEPTIVEKLEQATANLER